MLEKTFAIKAVLVAFVLLHFHRYNRNQSTPTSTTSYPKFQLLESFSAPSLTRNCFLLLQLLKPPYISSLRSSSSSSSSSHPVTNKMKKFLCVLLLCILSLVFYLSLNSPALSTRDEVLGRRLLGERRVPAPEPSEHKLKDMETKGGLEEHDDGDGDGEGLILNADYHGVKTHPSPLPKHPRP